MSLVRKKTSFIWRHFSQSNPNSARCNHCSRDVSVSSRNTGNLIRHLRLRHPAIFSEEVKRKAALQGGDQLSDRFPKCDHLPVQKVKNESEQTDTDTVIETEPTCIIEEQPTNSGNDLRGTKKCFIRKKAELDEQLIKMIAKEHFSLRIVDSEPFQQFVALLCPRYILPSRKTLSQVMVPQLYEKLKQEVTQKISEAPAVCLSVDAWTSINDENILAITAHYIDNDTKLCSNFLSCLSYEERPTSEHLTVYLREEMVKWNILDKVTAIVSDDTASVVAAIEIGEWPLIICFATSLNTIVTSAISGVQNTILKVGNIVHYFRRCAKAQETLQEVQEEMGIQSLKLQQHIPKLWNSVYEMLSSVVAMKNAIVTALTLVDSDFQVTEEEWKIVEDTVSVLKMFYEITLEMMKEHYVSISKVIVYCWILKNHTLKYNKVKDLSPTVQDVAKKLFSELERRFFDNGGIESSTLHADATLLDPRFKNLGFSKSINYENTLTRLKGELRLNNSESGEQNVDTSMATSSSSIWDDFDQSVNQLCNSSTAAFTEIDKYIQEPMLPRYEDPLKWWHEKRTIYPILYSYVLTSLNIVATSVPCEQAFSKTGLVLTDTRSTLHSRKLQELLFIKNNMK